ncbi:MAG: LysE family translocator [Pseudomonadota bacterium]
MSDAFGSLLLAWTAYVVGAASPGPSTVLIANAAMAQGRRHGLAVAAGVMSGSLVWGGVAAAGFAAALEGSAPLSETLRVLAGLYLLVLASRAARLCLAPPAAPPRTSASCGGPAAGYGRGALMHLVNPKAALAWLATIAIGAPAGASAWRAALVVATCAMLGVCIFGGYALLFATPLARRAYGRGYRLIEGAAALVFCAAGIALLLRRF